jgi:serine/threonine protein kinase
VVNARQEDEDVALVGKVGSKENMEANKQRRDKCHKENQFCEEKVKRNKCDCKKLWDLDQLEKNTDYLPRDPCGAPEYFSPEMLDGTGVDEMNDWWNLGILIYELIIGHSPFFRRNRHHMFTCVRTSVVNFPEYDTEKPAPYNIVIDKETRQIINALLEKDPNRRIGKNGVEEILKHPFFANQHAKR